MRLLKRSAFGWPPTRAGSAPCRNGMVAHYNGGPTGLSESASHARCISYWKRVRGWHLDRGWLDIGYSYGVCPHSYVFEGRGFGRVQAAQPGGNTTWTSCTFMIGGSERPSAGQIRAWRELRAWLRGKGLGSAVRGHRQFVSTRCPGNIIYGMVRDGTLSKGPGAATPTPTMGDDMIGLEKGDSGVQVKALQALLVYAGYDLEVDGDYGPKTSATVLKMRKDQGSEADSGDRFTYWAHAQLYVAIAKRHGGERGPAGPPGPQGPPGELPDDITVTGTLSVNTA